MANYIIDGTLLTNIAAAIRSKKGVSTTYTPAQMATAINGLTPKLDTATLHAESIIEAAGEEISANSRKSFTSSVDLSAVAVVGATVQCYGDALAYVSSIDVATNKVQVTAGPNAIRITQLTVQYYNLKIV